jgi:hypothetical protein
MVLKGDEMTEIKGASAPSGNAGSQPMQKQSVVCTCGKSNAMCPIHQPNGINIAGPAIMHKDFDEPMELVDSKELATLREQAKELAEALQKLYDWSDETESTLRPILAEAEAALLKYRESKS